MKEESALEDLLLIGKKVFKSRDIKQKKWTHKIDSLVYGERPKKGKKETSLRKEGVLETE